MMFDLTGFIISGFIIVVILGPPIIKKIRRKMEDRELKKLVRNTLAKYKYVLIQHENLPLYVGEVNRSQRIDDIESKIQEAEDDFITLFLHRAMKREVMLHKKLKHLLDLIEQILKVAGYALLDRRGVTMDIETYRNRVRPIYDEFTALTKLLFDFKYYQQ